MRTIKTIIAVLIITACLTSCFSRGTYNAHGHCMSERFGGYR
jgi:hypothetical protein